jgi:hypothetical protein
MTVLRDASGGLVAISPVTGIETWGPTVERNGSISAIVAPSGLHHLYARPAWERYGQAHVFASEALRTKRPDFPERTQWLRGEVPIPIAPGISAIPLLGMPKVQEWLVFHEASGTLVATDLLFHLMTPGFALGLVTRMAGTYKRLACSKLFLGARTDREAFRRSIALVLSLPFDRLIVAHGEPVLSDAHAKVQKALETVL